MNKYFRYESDLVNYFDNNYTFSQHSFTIKEMKIRWGNIDLVQISNILLPFSPEQCKSLSKPSSAKIFMRLKNKRPMTKQNLFKGLGLSETTYEKALSELVRLSLVNKNENLYNRNVNFVFPKVIITGYEAKLSDYNKAFYQACINKEYVDYSYMVFPLDVSENILKKHKEIIIAKNLGLIGVSNKCIKELIIPKRNEPIKPYLRLMNLALSNEYVYTQKAT